MRKLTFGLLFALVVGFAVAQDAKKEEPKKDAPKKEEPKKDTPPAPAPAAAVTTDYYPLAKGTKWTYTMGQTEVQVEVTDVTGGEAKLVTKHSNKVVADENIKVTADGVYRTKVNNTPIEPPVKLIGLKDGKPTKGEKWNVKSKVQQTEVSGEFEVKDTAASVKIGEKDYKDVVYVEGPKFMIAGTETAVRYWFAPKQGIVKLSYTIGGQDSAPLELKTFEAGK
jgi:hypothetical protein